ncbi:MAG: tRNA pseudouridine(13) synthase TruD [Candidatus Terraquivivens tikiterensis]|uniref:Probable tRNA pseudouridine synthase D n=1 Tax=Candidatus Terraquivivens tikiterensis TaxID=1980982 RepID=A0A2R7YB81_9ARCH|nr:MAG: tRNA pseudouridine(13) synthase TruD [Candidatus Terraquivivens tikiterensis]
MLNKLRPEDVERFIGIERYASRSEGVGGVIKESPDDFTVWEILRDGSDSRSMFEMVFSTEKRGGFSLCVLHKVDVDTISAVSIVSKLLGVKQKDIGICGIKDRRARSWQFITIPDNGRITSSDAIQLTERVWLRRVSVKDSKLSSAELYRNAFEIKISKLRLDGHSAAALVERTVEELKQKGIPNFFGHQRFGASRPITHVVGKLIIKGRLREAVEEFLMDWTWFEPKAVREARMRLAESWEPKRALEVLPRRLFYERAVADYIAKNPHDYVGALRRLPLRLRRLFVEAYSSYVFNRCLSRLLENNVELLLPSEGDLVVEYDARGVPSRKPFFLRPGAMPRALSVAQAGRLSVLLPTPGWRVRIPANEKGEVLERILEEEGVELEDFASRALPEAATAGGYRPVSIPSWEFRVSSIGDRHIWVNLSLPGGCYATSLLRELMKPASALCLEGYAGDVPSAA